MVAHAIEPGADVRKLLEVEAALGRDVRICVQREVGDGAVVPDEVPVAGEVPVHHRQCPLAQLAFLFEDRAPLRSQAGMLQPEPDRGDVRLGADLLPEHPLEHASALEASVGSSILRQVVQDRVRLEEVRAVVQLEDRDSSLRVRRRNASVRDSPCAMSTSMRSNGIPQQAEQQPGLVSVPE